MKKIEYDKPSLDHLSLLELHTALNNANFLIKRCNLSEDVISILELLKTDLQIEIYKRRVYDEKV